MRRLAAWFTRVLVLQHRRLPRAVHSAVMRASEILTDLIMIALIQCAVVYLTLVGVLRAFRILTVDFLSHMEHAQLLSEWEDWQAWHAEHDQHQVANDYHLPGEYD